MEESLKIDVCDLADSKNIIKTKSYTPPYRYNT